MNKLVITNYKNKILEAVFTDGKLNDMMLFNRQSSLDNIYIGKVENILSNIDACFVNIGLKQPCYYSISENKHIFLNPKKDEEIKCGDEILVQVCKDAIKSKNPVATSEMSLRGEYVVVNNSGIIGISGKINDKEIRNHLHSLAKRTLPKGTGCIIRTVCKDTEDDKIITELKNLSEKLNRIITAAKSRTCYSCLYQNFPEYIDYFILKYNSESTEIITDDKDIYDEFQDYLNKKDFTEINLKLYEDSVCSLSTLYNLNKELENAVKERVWLKSGAYLVIEQTEAMVVIDVNTGKSMANKNTEEHLLNINTEAAIEVCRQMRIRNLSGIIVVDFINMKKQTSMNALKDVLIRELERDRIGAKFVDITKLGLVEITRKRIHKSLKEQIREADFH